MQSGLGGTQTFEVEGQQESEGVAAAEEAVVFEVAVAVAASGSSDTRS